MRSILFPARRVVLHRLEEALREIGVLLVAFSPLDAAFSEGSFGIRTAALFLTIGVVSFGMALFLEARRDRDA